ncbi:MAG: YebC/PmpR family DNA-binding transcriptional regulator [Actinomycetota bacterium]|nr:YebC/PmpR family DNA-binding transcriptional regulator [Actinomycetota bacterium]
MSGHSKWHSIKHKKSKTDAKRGQLFSKLSQKIMVAAKEGGGNPEANPTLATAIETAKSYSMPAERIKRAIQKGTGELSGGKQLEHMSFEGYGEGGVAILVEVLTDNRNRASSDVKRVFTRAGAKIAEPGSVSWLFEKKGVAIVRKEDVLDEDVLLSVALEVGADDIRDEGGDWEIISDVEHFKNVRESLETKGIKLDGFELTMFPKNSVPLEKEAAKKVLKLLENLEELDDVHEVYANFEIPDEVMEEVASLSD